MVVKWPSVTGETNPVLPNAARCGQRTLPVRSHIPRLLKDVNPSKRVCWVLGLKLDYAIIPAVPKENRQR